MKQAVKAVFGKLVGLLEVSGRRKVAKQLLMLSDAQLKDVGFCRHKLLRGSSAYPWSIDKASPSLTVHVNTINWDRLSNKPSTAETTLGAVVKKVAA